MFIYVTFNFLIQWIFSSNNFVRYLVYIFVDHTNFPKAFIYVT